MTKRSSRCSQHSQDKKIVNQIASVEEKNNNLIEVREELANLSHKDDPKYVLREAEKKMMGMEKKDFSAGGDDPVFKAMTLREFDNGTLLTLAASKETSTFAIDLMRKIQQEYVCVTASEKAVAELASACFIRALEMQRRIKAYLDIGTFTGIGVQYVSVLSKDLDRANRQYLTAIQTLGALRQPPMKLSIRTNTAVIGQNQMVQTNEINEPK